MTLGQSPKHADLFRSSTELCEETLGATSIYRLLRDEGHRLFPDESFADLFTGRGRRSVPPRIVAVTMVLQRFEGLSDREAVDHMTFDLRWKYAAGDLDYDRRGFVHTVLCDMRARLRGSSRPNRIFEAVLAVAREAGLVGRRRVLDSTALYDAVATQDTVTLIRSAIVGVLRVASVELATTLRGALLRDDDYTTPGKPSCNWDDRAEREALVDALAKDGHAILARLDGEPMTAELREASTLLCTVLGQDLEQRDDGVFRIVRGVAPDRVISTVDPEARHGHKTSARGFDGYKGHVAIDPDSEVITATAVTAANAGDGSVAVELIADLLAGGTSHEPPPSDVDATSVDGPAAAAAPSEQPVVASGTAAASPGPEAASVLVAGSAASSETPVVSTTASAQVYGDASYGTAAILEKLESAGIEANVKVQAPAARTGCYSQDAFAIDLAAGTAECPQRIVVRLKILGTTQPMRADFTAHCPDCPQREKCTTSERGRVLSIHPSIEQLRAARARQRSPEWKRDYKATRPKVERKIAHLMRRRHGGRRARVRGSLRIGHDFALLAAAANLARLAVLGVGHRDGRWAMRPAA